MINYYLFPIARVRVELCFTRLKANIIVSFIFYGLIFTPKRLDHGTRPFWAATHRRIDGVDVIRVEAGDCYVTVMRGTMEATLAPVNRKYTMFFG
jgi:hypothetical protein